ncbi:MAG: flagellar filament capping protein FliD [Bacillota bacterium]|nr:flagellar filament capping protein FliD [Bacillota bacterium]
MSVPIFSVSGLATGLDWRKIIDELMAVERRPIQVLEQRRSGLETVKNAWSDLKLALQAVDTKLDPLLLSSTFQARVAVSSSEAVVKGTASSGASLGTYAIGVQTLAQAQVVASAAQSQGALSLAGDIYINGKTISVVTTDGVASIRDKINATAGVGVTASVVDTIVSGVTKSILVLKSNTTGTAGAMTLSEDANQVLTNLGVLVSGSPNVQVAAQDAELTVDGVAITSGSNTVTTAVPGVTLELKGTGSATLEVKADVDSMVGKIKDFVNAYNGALSKLRMYLANEPKSAGPLGGDPTAQGMERQLRQLAYDSVSGLPADMDSLYDIGISTSDKTGALAIDETKLGEALSARAGDVANLFYSSDQAVKSVAERLRDAFRLWVQAGTGVIPTRESGLDDLIEDMADRMEVLEERLKLREQSLVDRFVNLERSMAVLQSQSAWLEQKLAALQPVE